MSASLRVDTEGALCVGTVEGDIDLSSARELSSQILRDVSDQVDGLVLDLTQVRYLDSTGVSMLLDLHRTLDGRRQRLGILLPRSSHLWRLFDITGLASILRIGKSLPDAKAAVEA